MQSPGTGEDGTEIWPGSPAGSGGQIGRYSFRVGLPGGGGFLCGTAGDSDVGKKGGFGSSGGAEFGFAPAIPQTGGAGGIGGQPGKAINLDGGTINWISGRGFPNVIGEVS